MQRIWVAAFVELLRWALDDKTRVVKVSLALFRNCFVEKTGNTVYLSWGLLIYCSWRTGLGWGRRSLVSVVGDFVASPLECRSKLHVCEWAPLTVMNNRGAQLPILERVHHLVLIAVRSCAFDCMFVHELLELLGLASASAALTA